MSQTIASLWPDQIRPSVRSPNAILKAQAMALAQQTAGVLLGEIMTRQENKDIVGLEFNIVVPALGGYRHRVLTVKHAPDLPYPAIVDAEVFTIPENRGPVQRFAEMVVTGAGVLAEGALRPVNRADSDGELIALVARVLRSSQVLSAAQSLIARASDALDEEVQQPGLSKSSPAESSTVYDVDHATEMAQAYEDLSQSSAETSTVYEGEAQAENTNDKQNEPQRLRR